jgi:hypothetical protein
MMNNFKMINRACYYTAMGSILVGTTIGIAAVWVEDLLVSDFTPKGLATTVILFAASTLGALVTSMLVVKDEKGGE